MENKEKNFLQKHGKKILLAGGVIAGVGACVLLRKQGVELNRVKRCLGETINSKDKLEYKVGVLEAAATEGLYEEAIATVTRKINRRKDKLEFMQNSKFKDETMMIAIEKVEREINTLNNRKEAFIKAQQLVEIKDLDA